jgi:peptidoglycan/LPS O-acetylase OafA/YrhL
LNYIKNNSYRSDIDGLRAIAVLSVVGFHAFPGLIHGGFIGVDVFFVISGFLISTILVNDLKANQFSFSNFFARRIRRIFPSLILVLLFCFIFGWLDLLPDEFQQLGKHIAGGTGFIDNFLYWYEIGYFDQSAETKPLLHLWSLGVEEQFYLIFPLILWLGFQKTWNIKVFYVLFLASFSLNIWLSFTAPSAAFFLPFSRFWEFLIGYFVAIEISHTSEKTFFKKLVNENSQIISVVGFVLLAITFMGVSPKSIFPGFWALLPTIGTALILLTPQSKWVNRHLLSNSLLVKLGLISYPLYLWHWPLLSFAHIMQGETPSSVVRLIAIGISLLLAWLSYRYIELPIRFGESLQYKTQSLIAIMLFVGGLGIAAIIGNGFPDRIPEKFRQIQGLFQRSDNASAECVSKFGGGGNSYCQIGDISRTPTALLIGDSHAGHFFAGLNEYYLKKGGNLLNMGAGGCPPYIDIDFGKSLTNSLPLECHHYKDAFKVLFETPSIETVIFAFDHSTYLKNNYEMHFKGGKNTQGDNLQISTKAFKETIERINSTNRKVVLIYDMPDITIDLRKCFAIRPIELGSKACKIDSGIWIKDFDNYNRMIDSILKTEKMNVFMSQEFMGDNFPINKDGLPMYSDKTHLSKLGSKFFTQFYNF